MSLSSAYQRLPASLRMAIGQLRRGKLNAISGDSTTLARSTWVDRGEDWAKRYWDDLDAPQRKAMLKAVSKVAPFETLLELGCNSGPNLRLIQQRFPLARLSGIEFSDDAVRLGRDHFDIRQGTFDQISGDYDVGLSMWSLCCSPPSEIWDVLRKLTLACRAVVIIEPSTHGKSKLDTPLPTWRHNYAGMLAGFGLKVEAYPVRLPGHGSGVHEIVIWRR